MSSFRFWGAETLFGVLLLCVCAVVKARARVCLVWYAKRVAVALGCERLIGNGAREREGGRGGVFPPECARHRRREAASVGGEAASFGVCSRRYLLPSRPSLFCPEFAIASKRDTMFLFATQQPGLKVPSAARSRTEESTRSPPPKENNAKINCRPCK